MTEREILERQATNGGTEHYMQRSGRFYHAYGGGAFILARVMGYTVKRRHRRGGDVLAAGFPLASLPKVLEQLSGQGIEVMRADETGLGDAAPGDGLADDSLFVMRGGDPTPDEMLVAVDSSEGEVNSADNCRPESEADYRELRSLRSELLGLNLAECTAREALMHLRALQIRCLSHLPV